MGSCPSVPPGPIRLANAPVSYGAFELTDDMPANVPGGEEVLAAIAGAGYEGTELGPPGYLADRHALRDRLEAHGLALAGGYVPVRFGCGGDELAPLEETLDLFDAAGGSPRAVLADDCERGAPLDWSRFAEAVSRAAERARERGYEPSFHHHMGTRIETPAEIERLLELVDVPLLLDSGHLLAAGGDPVEALRSWRARIDYVHVKDVRLDLLRGGGTGSRRGAAALLRARRRRPRPRRIPRRARRLRGLARRRAGLGARPGDDPAAQIAAQARNRRVLAQALAR